MSVSIYRSGKSYGTIYNIAPDKGVLLFHYELDETNKAEFCCQINRDWRCNFITDFLYRWFDEFVLLYHDGYLLLYGDGRT